MEKIRFESLGVYLPEKVVSTQELISQMKNPPAFDLEDLTGIKNRRWRSESEDSFVLASKAGKACLEKSKYKASEIEAIIFCSITHFKDGMIYWSEPNMSLILKKELGLRETAINFDITAACAGMMTGVYLLQSMIQSGAVRNGMVISGECITPIAETAVLEIKDPIDDQFAALTVGDSGAAVIMDRTVSGKEGIEFIEMINIAKHADLCFGMPSSERAAIAMYTKAMELHKEAIDRLPALVGYVLNKYNLHPSEIHFVIPHQTSIRAIKTALKQCSEFLTGEKIPETLFSLQDFGNTSSTSHFIVLDDFLKKGKIQEGSTIFFMVQASGLVLGFIYVTIGKMEVA